VSICLFRSLFKIPADQGQDAKTLGEFFLRSVPFTLSSAELVCPASSSVLDAALPIRTTQSVGAKGLTYYWEDFHEMPELCNWQNGQFWNFYLAPKDYHWVHAPCAGSQVEACFVSGLKWPVNAWGRKHFPRLYGHNDRITYRWQHPQFGGIRMSCIGAMGVSSLRSELEPVGTGDFKACATTIQKGQRLLAFELGSTVFLWIENPPPTLTAMMSVVSVGDAL
jgi:phosphatidylserine decarboxylase